MGITSESFAKQVMAKKNNNPVKKKFDFLKENYDTPNLFDYTSFIKDLPIRDIFENSQYVFSEPLYGAKFFNFFMETNFFTTDQLVSQKEVLENHLAICEKEKYNNKEHLGTLHDTLFFIEGEINKRQDMSYIKEDLRYIHHMNKLCPVNESAVNEELDKIVNNISTNPSYITRYETFIEELKKSKTINNIKYFPLLIVKNTAIFLGVIGAVVGTVAMTIGVAVTVCLSVPPFIVASLIEKGVQKSVAESYIAIFNKQISMVQERISKEKDTSKRKNLTDYLGVLTRSKATLMKYTEKKKPIKESMELIHEGAVVFLAPYILPIPKRWIKGFLKTGWNVKDQVIVGDIKKMNNKEKIVKLIDNLEQSKEFYRTLDKSQNIEAKIIKYGVFNGVNADKVMASIMELHDTSIRLLQHRLTEIDKEKKKKPVRESSISDIVSGDSSDSDLSFDEDDFFGDEDEDEEDEDNEDEFDSDGNRVVFRLNIYSSDLYDLMDNPTSPLNSSIDNDLLENFLDFIFNEDDESSLEAFNNLLCLGNTMRYISEAAGTRSAIHAVRKATDFSTRVDTKVAKAVEPVNNFVSQTIDSVKKIDNRERRNRLIEGKFRFRLLKIVRNAIVLGGIWAINPAIAAITLLVGVGLDANADRKIRNQILDELKEELKIVDEKIEDAKTDSERQKKYELMRIKNKLEKDIKRIEYRLDHAS